MRQLAGSYETVMSYETMRQPAAAAPRNGEFMILEIVQISPGWR